MKGETLRTFQEWNVNQRALTVLTNRWDDATKAFSPHQIQLDHIVTLTAECDRTVITQRAFGLHVLHKIGQAINAVQLPDPVDQTFAVEATAQYLQKIVLYVAATPLEQRSFSGCVNFQVHPE